MYFWPVLRYSQVVRSLKYVLLHSGTARLGLPCVENGEIASGRTLELVQVGGKRNTSESKVKSNLTRC